MRVQMFEDPAAFLVAAAVHLGANAAVGTVLATHAQRRVHDPAGSGRDDWYAVVRDDTGAVVGAAMRTAPAPLRAVHVGPMPHAAARLLGRTLVGRGEQVVAANGSQAAARAFTETVTALVGGRVEVERRTRLFELRTPVRPRAVPGWLRPVTEADLDLATEWYAAFPREADEQAGRRVGGQPGPPQPPTEHEMLRRVRSGRTYFWVDAADRPVHLAGSNPPSLSVARIAPVYTPPEQRGRGWAAAAVHAVSTALLEEGSRVVLFTDLANPTSNALYERLGFEPVGDPGGDMADLVITGGDAASARGGGSP